MSFVGRVAAFAASIALGATSLSAQQSDATNIVKARNAVIMAAVAKRDATAMASVYTQDAEAIQGTDTIHGRGGIQKAFQSQLDQGLTAFDLETSLVDLKDGKISEVGTYLMTTATGDVMSQGTYLNTWTKEGDAWMIERVVVAERRRSA